MRMEQLHAGVGALKRQMYCICADTVEVNHWANALDQVSGSGALAWTAGLNAQRLAALDIVQGTDPEELVELDEDASCGVLHGGCWLVLGACTTGN